MTWVVLLIALIVYCFAVFLTLNKCGLLGSSDRRVLTPIYLLVTLEALLLMHTIYTWDATGGNEIAVFVLSWTYSFFAINCINLSYKRREWAELRPPGRTSFWLWCLVLGLAVTLGSVITNA